MILSNEMAKTETHRVMEWFGLEATCKAHPVSPPAMSSDTFHFPRVL